MNRRALLLVLLASAVLLACSDSRPPSQPSPTAQPSPSPSPTAVSSPVVVSIDKPLRFDVPTGGIALGLADFNRELYIADIATGDVERKTATLEQSEDYPAWSPDGTHFVYVRHGVFWTAPYELVLGDAMGTVVVLDSSDDRNGIWGPAWSPDSRTLAYLYGQPDLGMPSGCETEALHEIRLLDVITLARRSLDFQTPASCRAFGAPRWSPDGRSIAVAANGLYTMDLTSGEVRDLLSGQGVYAMDWSPDDTMIAAQAYGPPGQRGIEQPLIVVNADGTDQRVVAGWSLEGFRVVEWAVDGSFIAFSSGQKLLAVSPDGGEPWTLVDRPAYDLRFSPDGKQVAYFAPPGQPSYDIYITDLANGQERRLIHGSWQPGSLAWSPDGRKLAFTSGDAQPWGIYAALPQGELLPLWLTPDGAFYLTALVGDAFYSSTERSAPSGSVAEWPFRASFSPDGSMFALTAISTAVPFSDNCSGLDQDLFVLATATGKGLNVTNDTTASQMGPVAWSPDGQWLAVTGARGCATNRLEMIRPDGTGRRTIMDYPDTGKSVVPVAWSPDDNSVIFAVTTRGTPDSSLGLYSVDVQNGVFRQLLAVGDAGDWLPGPYDIEGQRRVQVVTGADEVTVAIFAREGFGVFRADSNGGLVRQVTGGQQVFPQFGLALSPDAKRVAYVTCDTGEGGCRSILNIYDIETDTTIAVASRTIIDSLAWSADGSQLAFVSHVPPCAMGEGLPPGRLEVVNADGSGLHTVIDRCIVRSIVGWAP